MHTHAQNQSTEDLFHVIYVWSPIGYEFYLTLVELYSPECVLMITARHFNPHRSTATLGKNHHYFGQMSEEIVFSCDQLVKLFGQLNGNNYIAYIPQSGNFYGRTLIESDFCKHFYYYDEGSAAYGDGFKRLSSSPYMKGALTHKRDDLIRYFSISKVDIGKLEMIYKRGAIFYDLNHIKLAGFLSFFEPTFPGVSKIILPIANITRLATEATALCVLPPLKHLLHNQDSVLSNLLIDIKQIIDKGDISSMIFKSHPMDPPSYLNQLIAKLPLQGLHTDLWANYCHKYNIDEYREPALMGFNSYITSSNSTGLYLEILNTHGELENEVQNCIG